MHFSYRPTTCFACVFLLINSVVSTWTISPVGSKTDCSVGSSTKLQDFGVGQKSLTNCKSACVFHPQCTDITWASNSHCILFDGCVNPGVNVAWQHYMLFDGGAPCSVNFPYAYRPGNNFDYCCASGDDSRGNVGINSGVRSTRSDTCYGDKFEKCRRPPCADFIMADVEECTGLESKDGALCFFMAKFRDFSTDPEDARHYAEFKTSTSFYLPDTPRDNSGKIRRYYNWDFEIDFQKCWNKREMCFGDAPPGCTCPQPNSSPTVLPQPMNACKSCAGPHFGLVEERLSNRTEGKPVYISKRRIGANVHNKDSFDAWFDTCHGCDPAYTRSGKDCSGCGYSFEFKRPLVATYVAGKNGQKGKYSYTNVNFFPLSATEGWGSQGNSQNFGFTTDLHLQFTYEGGETFKFTGDDDLWVFLGRQLFVDLGGMHSPCSATIILPATGCKDTSAGCIATVNQPPCHDGTTTINQQIPVNHLIQGSVYDFDLFHAERHTEGSTFKFETSLRLRKDTCQDMLDQLLDGKYPQPNAVIQAEPLADPNIDPNSLRITGQKQKCVTMDLHTQCYASGCLPGFTRVGAAYLSCDGISLVLKLTNNNAACRRDTTMAPITTDTTATNPTTNTKPVTATVPEVPVTVIVTDQHGSTATGGNGKPVTATVPAAPVTVIVTDQHGSTTMDGNGKPVTATVVASTIAFTTVGKSTVSTTAAAANEVKETDGVPSSGTVGVLLYVMLFLILDV